MNVQRYSLPVAVLAILLTVGTVLANEQTYTTTNTDEGNAAVATATDNTDTLTLTSNSGTSYNETITTREITTTSNDGRITPTDKTNPTGTKEDTGSSG